MPVAPVLPRSRRFALLTTLAAIGAALFVPFLLAGGPAAPTTTALLLFVGLATVTAAVATWLGLGWSDVAGLPMPLLRAWEAGQPWRVETRGVTQAIGAGSVIGAAGLALLGILHVPAGAGSFPVRAGSALFAAVTLEAVLHLAIMSGVVRATGRVWPGIMAATVCYMAFHFATLGGQPAPVVVAASIANGTAGVLFGWLYARRGYEYLVLAHLLAHLITVGFG